MSIGIAVAGKDGEAPDELLRKGDYVLYLRKGEGRGSFAFFEPGNERKSSMRDTRHIEQEARHALSRCGDGVVSAGVSPDAKAGISDRRCTSSPIAARQIIWMPEASLA